MGGSQAGCPGESQQGVRWSGSDQWAVQVTLACDGALLACA